MDEVVTQTRDRVPQRVKTEPGGPASGRDVDIPGKRCIIRSERACRKIET